MLLNLSTIESNLKFGEIFVVLGGISLDCKISRSQSNGSEVNKRSISLVLHLTFNERLRLFIYQVKTNIKVFHNQCF